MSFLGWFSNLMRFKHDFSVVKRALIVPDGDVAIETCRIPSLDTPNQTERQGSG